MKVKAKGKSKGVDYRYGERPENAIDEECLQNGKGKVLKSRTCFSEKRYGIHTSPDGEGIQFSFADDFDLFSFVTGRTFGRGTSRTVDGKGKTVEEISGAVETDFQALGTMSFTINIDHLDALEEYLSIALAYVKAKNAKWHKKRE